MAITSTSYLREDNVGVIVLYNDVAWSTAAWTMTSYFDAVYSLYNLYPVTKSGTGTLSNGSKTLTVEIPQPPKYLLLTVGSFNKRYSFIDGGIETKRELVYAPSISIKAGVSSVAAKSAFILFNQAPEDKLTEETYRATLARGKTVYGYALGQRFVSGMPSIGAQRWAFGGVLLPRVVWISRPSAGNLDFYLPMAGDIFRAVVPWNGTAFTGPSSSRFAVKSNDIFQVEREITYFFL